MKHILFVPILLSLLVISCSSPDITIATVQAVIDGDTVVLENGEHVRLIGIDSPEKGDAFYEEARNKAIELMEGKAVTLEKDVEDKDRYDRSLRYIWCGGAFINAEMVSSGYAISYRYPPNIKYAGTFDQCENSAKSRQLGMWQDNSGFIIPKLTIPPKTKLSIPVPKLATTRKYVGSTNSDKYHYPSCEWAKKISPANEIWFSSAADARAHGYIPCKVCDPPLND